MKKRIEKAIIIKCDSCIYRDHGIKSKKCSECYDFENFSPRINAKYFNVIIIDKEETINDN